MWELLVHRQLIVQKWNEITQGGKMYGREILSTFLSPTIKERSPVYIYIT